MRKAEISKSMMSGFSPAKRGFKRTMQLSAVALGVGLLMASGAARAGDDDEDDKTFEDKIIENVMRGIGGTNMDNTGIEYRERSPLVVPPKIDLPPPASATADVKAPNWPKDPDEARRKAAIAARKKENKDPAEARRLLTPSELNKGKVAASARTNNDPVQPGATKSETAPFKGEPTRDSLTQPPTGYQTPSPNFAYGTGPKESLNKEYNPVAGKYGD